MRTLLRFLRPVSYGMLAALSLAGLAITLPLSLGRCADTGGGVISCDSDIWRASFEQGATMMLLAYHTVAPLVLAGLGIVFLLRDVFFRPRAATDTPGES